MDKPRSAPEIEEFGNFLNKLNRESDRGAVLIAGTILDERLKHILNSFLLNHKTSKDLLDGFNAPLGTFSSRISACFALGLIQQNEFEELSLIRKIRNEFAHTWDSTDFESGKIKELCLKLPWTGPAEIEANSSSKQRFNFSIATLLMDLLWRAKLGRVDNQSSQTKVAAQCAKARKEEAVLS